MGIKIKSVRNISRTMVQVQEGGITHFLIPGQVVSNVEVDNLDEIRSSCEIVMETEKEDLSEVIPAPLVESGKVDLSEVKPRKKLGKTKKE